MAQSVKDKILSLVKSCPDRFIWADRIPDYKRTDIDVALYSLAQEQKLIRIISGLYFYPGRKKSVPSVDTLANAIADKYHWNISKTNEPGVYLASTPRTKQYAFNGQKITFKQCTGKKLAETNDKRQHSHYLYLHNSPLQDEQYTPKQAVELIIPYLEQLYHKLNHPITVWCPADTSDSQYYQVLSELPYCRVIATHLSDGFDFLTTIPDFEFDCIITNPPFRDKKNWLVKALKYNKPFALLLPASWLNDNGALDAYAKANKSMQLLIPNKRFNFIGNDKQVPFKAIYYCWDLLNQPIVYCTINKN